MIARPPWGTGSKTRIRVTGRAPGFVFVMSHCPRRHPRVEGRNRMRTVVGISGLFTLGLVACVGETPIVGSSENQNVGTGASDEPPSSIRYVVAALTHHEA